MLRLQNVSFSYSGGDLDSAASVRDVSLEIRPGECVGLVGRTGSGKSTLVQLMAGLFTADCGEIRLDDLCLTAARRPKAREICRRVGIVFQYPEDQLFAETVRAELAYAPENLGWPQEKIRQEVEEFAGRFGLTELLAVNPYQLSGGEQRKVALASVLIMRTPLLILDEPFVGLDARARREFLQLLGEWQRENEAAVVCISHDIEQLAEFCTRLLVMADGELRLDAPIREAFDRRELLAECGVYPPVGRQVVSALAERGWAVDVAALTVAEASNSIRNYLDRNGSDR